MNRRRFLGVSLASSMALLAGCTDDTEDMIEDAEDSDEEFGGEGQDPGGGV